MNADTPNSLSILVDTNHSSAAGEGSRNTRPWWQQGPALYRHMRDTSIAAATSEVGVSESVAEAVATPGPVYTTTKLTVEGTQSCIEEDSSSSSRILHSGDWSSQKDCPVRGTKWNGALESDTLVMRTIPRPRIPGSVRPARCSCSCEDAWGR